MFTCEWIKIGAKVSPENCLHVEYFEYMVKIAYVAF